jgi:hypothetical protein
MQQRAQDASHMRIVVDDQKAQAVEIDADHAGSGGGRRWPTLERSTLGNCR